MIVRTEVRSMFEFFKGAKRIVGCVALGLACVFTGAWIRIMSTRDEMTIYKSRPGWLVSHKGEIQRIASLAVTRRGPARGSAESVWRVRYSTIVCPLTLISAYLLLGKRPKRQQTVSDD